MLLLIQRQEQIQTRGSLAAILILDVIVVSLFALSLGVKLVEFYTVYFITIMLAKTTGVCK